MKSATRRKTRSHEEESKAFRFEGASSKGQGLVVIAKPGIAGLTQKKVAEERFKQRGDELAKTQLEQVEREITIFKQKLEEFALKHKRNINADPVFRHNFNEMCKNVGVDPLVSMKGFWSVLGMGDFYFELAVEVVEACLKTRGLNGGLVEMESLLAQLRKKRGPNASSISAADVEKAVLSLRSLGNGFSVKVLGGTTFVQSVPLELSSDHNQILESCQKLSHSSTSLLEADLKWPRARIEASIDFLLAQGIVWVDLQTGEEPHYWLPMSGI